MWARGTCGERAGYDICGPGGVIFVWAGRSSAIFVWAGRQSTLSKTSPIHFCTPFSRFSNCPPANPLDRQGVPILAPFPPQPNENSP